MRTPFRRAVGDAAHFRLSATLHNLAPHAFNFKQLFEVLGRQVHRCDPSF